MAEVFTPFMVYQAWKTNNPALALHIPVVEEGEAAYLVRADRAHYIASDFFFSEAPPTDTVKRVVIALKGFPLAAPDYSIELTTTITLVGGAYHHHTLETLAQT